MPNVDVSSPENAAVITALVITGKLLFNSGGSVCMIYMQEMFPTSLRYICGVFIWVFEHARTHLFRQCTLVTGKQPWAWAP